MTFDITIPVLNEEETLASQINILHTFLCEHFPDRSLWRIVIADNGSTDQTPEIGQALTKSHDGVHFLQVPEKGVGLALKTSWSASTADVVGYMDLDLATDLSHFLEAQEILVAGNADMVYGSRLHRRSRVTGRTLKREFISRTFNKMLKVYLGTHFSDGMCGFKWLKRSCLTQLMEGGAVSNGWFFSTELLAVAEWQNIQLYELPVTWTDDTSSSKVNIQKLAIQYIKAMKVLKLRKKENLQRAKRQALETTD
jgi:glycosyltransferase involved in cell wall biosynthesis